MNGLIVLVVIFAIVETIVSKNKKKAEQAKRKGGAQRAAQPDLKPKSAPRQVKIPYTKEEWSAYLSELNGGAAPVRKAPRSAAKQAAAKPASVASAPEPLEAYEGMISTQGESHEEHAEHRRRIAQEEAQHQQERDALANLREANLERLRAAVVMSEVLGKPVSLRPRGSYYR